MRGIPRITGLFWPDRTQMAFGMNCTNDAGNRQLSFATETPMLDCVLK